MFYYIKGTVAHVAPYLAVIDCGGVGYACRTTNVTLSALKVGQPGKLYTHLNVREDAMELYGFATEEELNCFQMLLGVSGVGPKAALSILSSAPPEKLALAIITGDEKALTAAQGIGKKIAQRIILELKDKMQKQSEGLVTPGAAAVMPAAGGDQGKLSDGINALSYLGYSRAECTAALKGVDLDALSTEDAIRAALRNMTQ